MQKNHTSQAGGFWLVTGSAIMWGTIGIATQAIYNSDPTTSSLFINLARMLVATPLLLVVCWQVVGRSMFQIRRRDWLIMLLIGTLLACSHAAYFASIRHAGVTIATLLAICVAPLVVTGLAVLLKLETLTRRVGLALICALVGSVLLVGLHAPNDTQDNLLLGTFLALISAATYASMIVGGRFLAADYHPLQITAVTFSAGTIALILVNLVSGTVAVQSPQGWLLVVYLGLVPTALAYGLFQTGLRSISATAASIVSMLDPVVTVVLAWVLFGETLPVSGIAGGVLLILSIFFLKRG